MTRDEIIRMAIDAGLIPNWETLTNKNVGGLEHFAALVAEAEREACAQVCEEWGAWNRIAQDCAAAIRARGTHA